MRLEEALKVKQFKNAFHKATLDIMYTSEWLSLRIDRILKPYGVSMQQYNVLRILKGQHPKPVNLYEIQERMISRMSNATRLVEKLKQKGLAERKTCENNRRKVEITITGAGINMLEEIMPKLDAHDSALATALSENDASQLSHILEKLRKA